MSSSPHRIDVHHHIFPPAYLKAAADAGIDHAGGFTFPQWSAESALALMDRNGIATAITSLGTPGVHFGNDAAARDLARYCNEYAARLVMDHPTRLGAFATLPLPDVDGALKEIEYALDTLKLDGVNLLTNVHGTYLGDPAFDAVFAELNRRKAVVFVHPETPPAARDIKLSFPGAMIEFTFDTTRMTANLILSGTLERYPDVKIILPHAGGTVPYLLGASRSSTRCRWPGRTRRREQSHTSSGCTTRPRLRLTRTR
jgi:predicted TIM-barrel fold metal-dependent hydrolase